MTYHCPSCGKQIDGNIYFQAMGQCLCDYCGEIVDLTNVSGDPVNKEIEEVDLENEN